MAGVATHESGEPGGLPGTAAAGSASLRSSKVRDAIRVGINARTLCDDSLRGFNRYLANLVRHLSARDDIDVLLYTDDRSPPHRTFRAALDPVVVELAAPRVLLWEQVVLPGALRRDAIGVFHAPTDNGLPWITSVKSVLTYHSATDAGVRRMIRDGVLQGRLDEFMETGGGSWERWRHDALRWLYLRRADRVITVSRFAAKELVELLGVPAAKIRVVHEAPDDIFHVRLPADHVRATLARLGVRRPYVLFVSGFDRIKNVRTLLEVWANVRVRLAPHALVLAGAGGDIAGARKLAGVRGLSEGEDVVFLERVQSDLPALYQGATLFVTLSWRESFCFPVVEAMASGVPVVASCLGAIPEIATDAAVLVDPREPTTVAAALEELVGRRERRAELAERGRTRVAAFRWEKTAAETVAVYREVLGRR